MWLIFTELINDNIFWRRTVCRSLVFIRLRPNHSTPTRIPLTDDQNRPRRPLQFHFRQVIQPNHHHHHSPKDPSRHLWRLCPPCPALCRPLPRSCACPSPPQLLHRLLLLESFQVECHRAACLAHSVSFHCSTRRPSRTTMTKTWSSTWRYSRQVIIVVRNNINTILLSSVVWGLLFSFDLINYSTLCL